MSVTSVAAKRGAAPPADAEVEEAPKSRKKLFVVVGLVVVLLAAGGYFFLKPSAPAGPKPGAVVTLEPIQINLAGDHYLRIGVALQLTDAVKEADGSKALDATIDEFSGRTVAEVTSPVKRRALKRTLVKHLGELYEGEVMGIYFTEFVTQ